MPRPRLSVGGPRRLGMPQMASAMTRTGCDEVSASLASPRSSASERAPRSTLRESEGSRSARRSPSDEALVTSARRGDERAFGTLAARYQPRLLRFCWQILRSREDAEDALQDVFIAAFNAIRADDREIHVRPWLYRIARNRCINHLRRATAVGAGSMDDYHAEHGRTLVEKVVGRQRFLQLVSDVQVLPDTQRTALLLCEVDGFSYAQIALAMSTTVPAVKSLLVRARLNLLKSAAERDATRTALGHDATPARRRATARRSARPISYQRARAVAIGMTWTPRTTHTSHGALARRSAFSNQAG